MKLLRGHGLGNDYLILEDGPRMTPELARAICDRHTGVGADGVLEPAIPVGADYGVRIWNPDGSVAEKSGNGLRIFARWLHSLKGARDRFAIWTGHDVVRCHCTDASIRIQMGRFTATPRALAFGGLTRPVVIVDVGNPHCVFFHDAPSALDTLPWRRWGAEIETHDAFPDRTNVQIAAVRAPDRIEARIWERGAGETLASGSSSCAVVIAAVRTGRIAGPSASVEMPGGSLAITVDGDRVELDGPAELVARIEVLESYYRFLGVE